MSESTKRTIRTLEAQDIQNLLPHRYPILLVDRILDFEPGKWIRGMKNISIGALLHDIGKIEISGEILTKPDKLTPEEFEQIKNHPFMGAEIVKPVKSLEKARDFILYHHERYDGNGYPFGLKDEEIPLGARIMAVADIFTAIREKRPYRDPMTKEDTINVLVNMANAYEIDEKIVEIVKSNFDEIDLVREEAYKNTILEYEKFTEQFEKLKKVC